MPNPQQVLRNVRIIHFAFLAMPALLVFAVVVAKVPIAEKPEPSFLPLVLGALAASEIGIGTALRAQRIRPTAEALLKTPEDGAAAQRWVQGNLLSFAFPTTISLFGVVVRVQGFPWNIALWFFVAGFCLLLLWRPRLNLPPASTPPPPIS